MADDFDPANPTEEQFREQLRRVMKRDAGYQQDERVPYMLGMIALQLFRLNERLDRLAPDREA